MGGVLIWVGEGVLKTTLLGVERGLLLLTRGVGVDGWANCAFMLRMGEVGLRVWYMIDPLVSPSLLDSEKFSSCCIGGVMAGEATMWGLLITAGSGWVGWSWAMASCSLRALMVAWAYRSWALSL